MTQNYDMGRKWTIWLEFNRRDVDGDGSESVRLTILGGFSSVYLFLGSTLETTNFLDSSQADFTVLNPQAILEPSRIGDVDGDGLGEHHVF